MIWVIDKKIVRHLIEHGGQLLEVPIRVSFEYAVESGTVVDGSLSLQTLYNKASVKKCLPGLDDETLDSDVQASVERSIDEHLAMSGLGRYQTAIGEDAFTDIS